MNFITGHAFKNKANYILDEYGFRENIFCNNSIPVYFVKTDYIHKFFNSSLLPNSLFELITHNSDYSINIDHAQYLNNSNLQIWFAQNVNYKHPKLIPIPIGIANIEWPHGNTTILQNIIYANYHKNILMYANFNINTNIQQRNYCLKYIPNKFIENNVPFHTYLSKIAQSYFNICPLGNGIDSHRIWESLYLKTVPIVENTYNIRYLTDRYNLPILLIDDWSELQKLELNENHYQSLMINFNPKILTPELFI